jgi:3-phenylpropionate/cinnamic acid dioxygenase small subunit
MTTDAADHFAILGVLAAYCHACDDGDFDRLSELFTPEGTFTYAVREVAGRAALREYFTEVQTPERRGKHLTANPVLSIDGDAATVTSDWVFLVFDQGVLVPKLTGRYEDTLVRAGQGWQLAARLVVPMLPAGCALPDHARESSVRHGERVPSH